MRRTFFALALLSLSALPATAMADAQSLFTLGVGTELGVNRHTQVEGDVKSAFVSEVTGRVRLLKVLGLSFAYNVAPAPDTGELVFTSKYRLTSQIYVVPTQHVSFYLAAGLGAQNAGDLIKVMGSTNAYHAGAGLEVYLGAHFALHLEYLWLVPGARSIKQSVKRRALADVSEQVEQAKAGAVPDTIRMPGISASDYLDPGNFQLNFGVRWYL